MESGLRTVLIFAHECAPYHRRESTVGAQRPAQFARHLAEFGWRAIVICRDASRREHARRDAMDALEDEVRQRMSASDPSQPTIIPTPSLPWDGALDRLWRKTGPERGGGRLAGLVRKPLTVAKLLTGDYSQNWQPCARAAARVVAESTSVDLCIGEHSPDAGLFLARWFSREHGVPWVADFRDPILQPLKPLLRRIYGPIARRLVSTAARTVNVNRFWADLDRTLFGLPSTSIPNGFEPDEFEPAPPHGSGDRVTVAYIGNIIANQDLEIFLDGLALARPMLREDWAKLRFLYRGLMSERVLRQVRESGVEDVADVAGYVDRPQALREQQRADLLLLLSIARPESEDVYYTKGIYPAKVFEYLGARRPILCVPGDGGLLDDLVRETNAGVIVRTPRDVAELLASIVRAPGQLPYAPAVGAVEQYTRRALTARLAAVLDEVVGAGH